MSIELLSPLISTFGLMLDIIGAFIIYKFGLPDNINRSGNTYLMVRTEDQKEINKGEKYDRWSSIGIFLLIAGFIFQGIGNWI